MASSSFLSLGICFFVIFNACFAQLEQKPFRTHHAFRFQRECRLENLQTLQPTRRVESEAGMTEFWDQNEDQLQCAGVAVVRYTLQRQGLLLPGFSNSPKLVYVTRGQGIEGAAIPGCAETYQSESESHFRGGPESEKRFRDQHQMVRNLREGDILAIPAGVAHWIYNRGQEELVLVALFDVSNEANQLDQNLRKFYLAGNPDQEPLREIQSRGRSESERPLRGSQRGSQKGSNVFSGFDEEIIAESFRVDEELARKIRGENDMRDRIVRVERDFDVLTPQTQEQEERYYERQRGSPANGFEETICSLRLKYNIGNPERADIFNPRGGRINTVNSHNLPILRRMQLSAERGVLYSNAIIAPQYSMNSHSVIYCTRGNGRLQIADNYGRSVFDGQMEKGQLLMVPQNFVVIKKAGDNGFEWIAFKTNNNAMTNPLAGRVSAMRSMPEDVLVNAYRISREEARRLKYNREELTVFSPGSRSQGRY